MFLKTKLCSIYVILPMPNPAERFRAFILPGVAVAGCEREGACGNSI